MFLDVRLVVTWPPWVVLGKTGSFSCIVHPVIVGLGHAYTEFQGMRGLEQTGLGIGLGFLVPGVCDAQQGPIIVVLCALVHPAR